MAEKRKGDFTLGDSTYNLTQFIRDPRGIEAQMVEILEEDWQDFHIKLYGAKMVPYPDAADVWEYYQIPFQRYHPVYTDIQGTCQDCPQGPCDLEAGHGKCSLGLEPFQAKLALRHVCRGALSQMVATRELLNYAIKVYGRDKEVHQGGNLVNMCDWFPSAALFSAVWVRNLGHVDQTLTYAEVQLAKSLLASYQGTGSAERFESMSLQIGWMQGIAQTAAEMMKVSIFGLISAASKDIPTLTNWPPATSLCGLGQVEPGKPVVAFAGDYFVPMWVAINQIKESGLGEQIEVCGIGPAGDDGIRYYDRMKILGPMLRAGKVIRSGIVDVLVASPACVPVDYLGEARRTETRVIWTGSDAIDGLPDRTEDDPETIVKDLIAGTEAAWIRDWEKAAAVAVKAAQGIKRKGGYILSESAVKKEAARCQKDCDLCFSICPLNLHLNQAVKAAQKDGIKALAQVERDCYFCGKCDEACPARIPLRDLIIAAQAQRIPEEKHVIRAGRGPLPMHELVGGLSGLMGNSPGGITIFGCGDAPMDDIAWMARQLLERIGSVNVAGCAAAELGRYFNEKTGKFIYEQYECAKTIGSLINCGGCAAIGHLLDNTVKSARIAAGISTYANPIQVFSWCYAHSHPPYIIWGASPERMMAIATAYAGNTQAIIVGPTSGFEWKRFLMGNQYDRSSWWAYDGVDGHVREEEPATNNLIVPVETREEALIVAERNWFHSTQVRDQRVSGLDFWIDCNESFFGSLPPEWELFVRDDMDLPPRKKPRLLKELRDKHGWEVQGLRIKRLKDRSGNLETNVERSEHYSTPQGRYMTHLHRYLASKGAREAVRQKEAALGRREDIKK